MEEVEGATDGGMVCYSPTMVTANGVWEGNNPLDFTLPLFIMQLTMIVVMTRLIVYILKPFRQPRVIAEILGGVLLGPSVLGQSESFARTLFPMRSIMILETMANVGLLYFLFLIGVGMDIDVIRRIGKKAVSVAVGGMVLPFIVGIGFTLFLNAASGGDANNIGAGSLFLGISLSVTAFPVLARILTELKLINTDLGKIAMSSAIINDIFAWIALALAIAMAEGKRETMASLWVVLAFLAFILVSIFIVRPAILWMIRQTPEEETVNDFYICLILTGVMVSGFITKAIGTHSIFGAFVFGLIIPNGPLGVALIEKLEDFVTGLLLPLYFATTGLQTNVWKIVGFGNWMGLILLVFLATLGKVIGTLLVTTMYQISTREGISLGLLMNTKGLMELIILNVGKNQKVLNDTMFATMIVAALMATGIITPIVTAIYRPAKMFIPYKRRTLQKSRHEGELHVLACVHSARNVPTIINLLEATNPTKKSPMYVYVLHLVELTGRASAMLIAHNARSSDGSTTNRTHAQSENIMGAFESYGNSGDSGYISVEPLTVISPYSTMHEDICHVAEEKRAMFVIIPFHKQQTVDGAMEVIHPAIRTMNTNVLANAPCSVGILVDRGLNGGSGSSTRAATVHNVVVLFFGGPDDREALAYGWRMSEHAGVSLVVMRFVAMDSVADQEWVGGEGDSKAGMAIMVDEDLDEECLNEFRMKTANDGSVMYVEKMVRNGEETVGAIKSFDSAHDLFIVGRGQGMVSPLTAGLTEWSDCPELGAIGDLLASSDFLASVSVLVVQQYVGVGQQNDQAMGPVDSPRPFNAHFRNKVHRPQQGILFSP
ncbi:hypothetical protein SAY87_016530 [Trapa incisa]|uniref:Cation/H+ exchanger domain-containing protein n=1 Tax=Trapa incisa TaxID=236973 RepID=A0AAN7QUF7_9MYRT|nr:hypothetical protein SAY87_016530 [Trapa incisa]